LDGEKISKKTIEQAKLKVEKEEELLQNMLSNYH
jgi:hypothetical protein